MNKAELFIKAKETYYKLLPNLAVDKVQTALEATWYEGITLEQLTKASYQYLYPPREPSLW